MAEFFSFDGLSVQLGSAATADVMVTSIDMPTPEPRFEWVGGSDSEAQRLTRAPKHQNRVITLGLRVKASASLDAAWDLIGPVIDKLAKAASTPDGVDLVWIPDGSSRTNIFDLYAGELNGRPVTGDGGGDVDTWMRYLHRSPTFDLRLHCGPYMRRNAEESVSSAASTNPSMSINVPSVGGDVPAIAPP